MPESERNRVDGWKDIAQYLGKDTSTVMRWARGRGMPVHKLPGGKRGTVYAYTDELDAWLNGASEVLAQDPTPGQQEPAEDPPAPTESPAARHRSIASRLILLAGGLVLAVAFVGLLLSAPRNPTVPDQVSFTGSKLIAKDGQGGTVWEFEFPQRLAKPADELEKKVRFVDLDGDGKEEILAIAAFAEEGMGDVDRDELYCFSSEGRVLWVYVPKLTLSFAGRQFEGPWYINDFLISSGGASKNVWLGLSHHTWWPSFVVKLDAGGSSTVQFINSGGTWQLSYVQNDSGSYVLAGGVNNEYEAGVLAVLEQEGEPATSPQSADPIYTCDSCPPSGPYRYFVFPRSELNTLKGGPFNPVYVVHASETQVELWSNEIEDNVQLIFQLSKDLEIKSVTVSDGYAEEHRRLSRAGQIDHPLQECPFLSKPYALQVWDRQRGWVSTEVPWASGQKR
jgi:hypothetical protein